MLLAQRLLLNEVVVPAAADARVIKSFSQKFGEYAREDIGLYVMQPLKESMRSSSHGSSR